MKLIALRPGYSSLISAVMLLAVVCCFQTMAPADDNADQPNDLARFYGFTGVELFKLDQRAFNLTHGDFNGDGRTDLIVVDNRTSCLRRLTQKADTEKKSDTSSDRVNDLVSDWRFEIDQIPVDKQIVGMTSNDFNNDGRRDVAYVGLPDRLVVRYQPEKPTAEWSQRWSVRLPGLVPTSWMISSGDLNSDNRTDLVVLGKTVTYVVYQGEDGKMQAPEQLINTSSQLSMIQVADINADGRDDLCYMANEGSSRGLCARLQTNDGRLGPEYCFDLQQPRSVTLADVDNKAGAELLTVDNRTGRISISQLVEPEATDDELPGRLVQFGIGEATSSRGRAVAFGDLDDNGLTDVVVTDPDNAQILVFRQNGIDGLGTAETFPSLLGATDVAVADTDGNGTVEVIVMSNKESAIAVSRFENGRMTFPRTVAKPEEDFEFEAIRPLGSNLMVCQKKGSGSRVSARLHQLTMTADAQWTAADGVEVIELPSDAVGSRGTELLTMNTNGDDHTDLLIVPVGSSDSQVHVYLGREGGTVSNPDKSVNLDLGVSATGSLFAANGQLLVARESFGRAMSLTDSEWTVDDQFNAGESKARISGIAALDLDSESGDEIVLVDSGIKKLRILKSASGLFRPWKEVDLGSLKFGSSQVADLNGDGRDDLLLFGNEFFSVLYSGQKAAELTEIASFELDRDNAYAADVVAGDINGDGIMDLSVIDTSIDGLQLLQFDPDKGIQPVTHFRMFEEKRLVSESNSRGTEPREGLAVDVTGDGLRDLVLLCHDRLILYPQDSGDVGDQPAGD